MTQEELATLKIGDKVIFYNKAYYIVGYFSKIGDGVYLSTIKNDPSDCVAPFYQVTFYTEPYEIY